MTKIPNCIEILWPAELYVYIQLQLYDDTLLFLWQDFSEFSFTLFCDPNTKQVSAKSKIIIYIYPRIYHTRNTSQLQRFDILLRENVKSNVMISLYFVANLHAGCKMGEISECVLCILFDFEFFSKKKFTFPGSQNGKKFIWKSRTSFEGVVFCNFFFTFDSGVTPVSTPIGWFTSYIFLVYMNHCVGLHLIFKCVLWVTKQDICCSFSDGGIVPMIDQHYIFG